MPPNKNRTHTRHSCSLLDIGIIFIVCTNHLCDMFRIHYKTKTCGFYQNRSFYVQYLNIHPHVNRHDEVSCGAVTPQVLGSIPTRGNEICYIFIYYVDRVTSTLRMCHSNDMPYTTLSYFQLMTRAKLQAKNSKIYL